MPHIDLPEGVPGIRSAKPRSRSRRPRRSASLQKYCSSVGENTLTEGERELIAAYV